MFTGLVQEVGEIIGIYKQGLITRLRIRSKTAKEIDQIGDSICVNGVCLTVTSLKNNQIQFDLSPETLSTTTLGSLKISNRVNIERALKLGDRLGGHFLTGHIDGVGQIIEQKKAVNHLQIAITYPPHLNCGLVEKGSIGIDGVSLTIVKLEGNRLWVSIIPHTAKATTLEMKKIDDRVNVETDLIGKYIYRFLENNPTIQHNRQSTDKKNNLKKELLMKHGFIP